MVSLKQSLIDLKNEAVRPYYVLRSREGIWKWLNADARRRFEADKPSLSEAQAGVVRDLGANGVAVTHLDDLFPGRGAEMLAELQELAAKLETTSAKPNEKKTFLTWLVPLYEALDLDDPFVRFTLSSEVMDCVSSYLGMWPTFYYRTLAITNPIDAGSVPRQSQCWHRDPEDRKMCKVFIYLSDVDESSGPFIYAKRSTQGNAWGKLYPQRPPHGVYPPEGAVERDIPKEDILVNTGRAGSVVFADTAGLHKGGYATTKRRIMSTSGFVPKACTRGVFYYRPKDYAERSKTLTPMVRYALDNEKISNRDARY